MRKLRIAFVGHFEYNSGCSQAVLGYARAAAARGDEVRVSTLGIVDDIVTTEIAIADESWKPDIVVTVFESYQYLTPHSLPALLRWVPRARRIVIDNDGKASAAIRVRGDTNHDDDAAAARWSELFAMLSDVVLQPTLGEAPAGAAPFLFFGVNARRRTVARDTKDFEILYVGNNWYRWDDWRQFLEAVAPRRNGFGRIAIYGKWWSGEALPGLTDHTWSDPIFLRRHGVEVFPSVPFGSVEESMGRGVFNPVFVRPSLYQLRLVTPRMFETFAADTVPMLAPYLDYLGPLLGEDGDRFRLASYTSTSIADLVDSHESLLALKREISGEMASRHSYDSRLDELIAFCR